MTNYYNTSCLSSLIFDGGLKNEITFDISRNYYFKSIKIFKWKIKPNKTI